ncbi:enhanced serine sensitivity protein SseB C-terminal domain-containing protein [Roseibacterium beibuensis]|uniref:enhanced serine sensitivity protein SseB C-terminal domain-containing protein n=1 Tax=[Roseibacterium] beibuensis TaxID=1193142 RepID=UPI00217DA0DC|nr:enhanced serine sensitivity protein SseB C-terminal domain-containing protein [Roseibacterium beibuensis]MCS6627734.1 enhanced serine sensitivity protein SseB C-terminal domain-containing protein [Roseibacterium beibuensis]
MTTASQSAPARPPFEPLNDLERLLVGAASGGADARAAFEAAVPDAELWVVPAPGEAAADVLRLRTVAQDGRPATVVFTARERAAQAMGPDVEPVAFNGRVLLETIRVNPAVLNPGHGYGARWSPDAMAALIGRPNPPRADRYPTQVATPAATPPGLVEALTRELSAEPAVKAAWLALARWNDGEAGFLLDIRGLPDTVPVDVLMQRALAGVSLDTRLDVVLGPPDAGPGAGLEIVAPR